MERRADHPSHLWYVSAAGVVRCALQGCDAEPTEMQAAEAVAEAELAASMGRAGLQPGMKPSDTFLWAGAAIALGGLTWLAADREVLGASLLTVVPLLGGTVGTVLGTVVAWLGGGRRLQWTAFALGILAITGYYFLGPLLGRGGSSLRP